MKNKYLIGVFLILALPLITIPPLLHPSAWGKTILFRIILSALIFLFIYQFTSNKGLIDKKILRSKSFWMIIVFLGISLLATIFSSDIWFSLWGSPYRAGGFIDLLCYVIFALLTFLVLKQKDWQKVWDFSIIIGVLVSAVAIFQQFGIFSGTLISFAGRPPSTIGSPIFLGLYILLLTFITLSFGLKEKSQKRIFYFLSALLFVYIIIITGSRASYFGLLIGSLYFVLTYPKKQTLVRLLKILFISLLLVAAYGIYYLNTAPKIPESVKENYILREIVPRLSINLAKEDPRFSAWLVSLEAIKSKPILGYGPENFYIGFNEHYDASLPYLDRAWGSWWDRAHNFIFDLSVTIGIPGLIAYILMFGVLIWELQKVKRENIIAHGIQATFFAYLAANLFTFDLFSTYLISFLLMGYSLHLISPNNTEVVSRKYSDQYKWRKPVLVVSAIVLVWFVWSFNMKPLDVNAEINRAKNLLSQGKCNEAVEKMESSLDKKSFLNSFYRLEYVEIMKQCAGSHSDKNLEYAERGITLLEESAKAQPKFARTWILLGSFTNVLIEKNPAQRKELVEKADYYFSKAKELSPKHQEIFIEWSKTYMVAGNYNKMKELSNECVELNPETSTCYWYLGLSEIFLGEKELAEEHITLARRKEHPVNSLTSLNQLLIAYTSVSDYEKIVGVLEKLIEITPDEPKYYPTLSQYHASLAFVYRELGDYTKAKEEALIFLELDPSSKDEVDLFLKTLL